MRLTQNVNRTGDNMDTVNTLFPNRSAEKKTFYFPTEFKDLISLEDK